MSGIKETLEGLAVELGVESPVAQQEIRPHPGAAAEQASRALHKDPAGRALKKGRDLASPLQEEHVGKSGPASGQFAISVAAGRIYVQNMVGKVVEVGDLVEENGIYAYRLDAGGIQGQRFASLDSALRHLASQLTYLYLDALFQQLPDSAAEAGAHSMSGPALRIDLAPGTDELRGPDGQETVSR